ncbi:4a-hydroxytetrahydrobiopterin dehydratase [Acidocella aminolytica]|uniref:Putative pterin-4-alpha-carbinolamine dehydratase n=1 Tax=Acidocella aminolytica 101 = DSM 11237 TaxID=1120923 RepID=A0A0D6PAC2_9PROT|nr:4a-hydroxytetrahydrobiopterin dehydratase [Acidocella aminolytica]GAN78695.1 pterin-4-alpha-carbinolamine dehydratase [Acidocella aminolytica 101 = DSM 11237]GBQ33942.1 pterin-4a-carbinolamine dehydratase [Acidocella aminolytica 101 = DSM 11237]SHE36347.1 4a-hydroxytetrahydrobiopterin dehydratase [Acidocella aminolytica 101 = DSM 11237]
MPKLLGPEAFTNLPPKWHLSCDQKSICQEFTFKSFSEAFSFMTHVAMLAEKLDHHPDWSNSYNKVSISLSTHSAGGLTDKDLSLAKAISAFVWLPQ